MNKRGFSLVEASISIAVIAIIFGIAVSGNSLLHQSRIRSIISDVNTFQSAFTNFATKYDAVPGDMGNAYNYWGTSCAASSSLCNGDNNRRINDNTNGTTDSELWRSWQHLFLSGNLKESYSGTATTSGEAVPGTNVPRGSLRGTGFTAYEADWWGKSRSHFVLGGIRSGNATDGPGINGTDAQNIDEKMDDGINNQGSVWYTDGVGASGCSISDKSKKCRVQFEIITMK